MVNDEILQGGRGGGRDWTGMVLLYERTRQRKGKPNLFIQIGNSEN